MLFREYTESQQRVSSEQISALFCLKTMQPVLRDESSTGCIVLLRCILPTKNA